MLFYKGRGVFMKHTHYMFKSAMLMEQFDICGIRQQVNFSELQIANMQLRNTLIHHYCIDILYRQIEYTK